MRTTLALLITTATLFAEDAPRHAERTPPVRVPPAHTQERAGNPRCVAWWARPSVSRYEAGGYVGGETLKGNRPLSQMAGGLGPQDTGTFGWDYIGCFGRSGRVFLGPSGEHAHERDLADGYKTDGRHVPDVFNLRPIRRAVLDAKENNAEHKKE